MGYTKVFVGNLSFKTIAAELAAEFSCAGKVVSAKIIARRSRSLGYGFVEFESEEDAQKAVAMLHHKTIDSREINVEVARPLDEAKIAERRQERSQRGGGRGGRRFRGGRANRGGERREGDAEGGARREGGDGGARREGEAPRKEVGRREGEKKEGERNAAPRGNAGGPRGGRGARRGNDSGDQNAGNNNKTNNNSDNTGNNNTNNQDPQPRRNRGSKRPRGGGSRRPFQPRDNTNQIPSQTTLFVSNLPFVVDDARLFELFKDLNASKAHVAKNRYGRSKGFGFVEFENENDQKAALTAMDKKVVDTRELIVKIALNFTRPATSDSAPAGENKPNTSEDDQKDKQPSKGN